MTGKPARQLRTAWTEAWERDDAPATLPMPLQGLVFGDAARRFGRARDRRFGGSPVGQIVGQMNAVRPAKDVVYDDGRGVDRDGRPSRRDGARVSRDDQLDAIQAFVDLVVASSRSPRQRERMARAAGLPVTLAGSSMLGVIERHGPLVVTDLAGRLGLDQSTVSRQVRGLEDLQLVERTADPADGRSSLLSIAPEGARLLARLREVARNDFDAALDDWSDTDRQALADLLDRFRRALVVAEVDDRGWSKRRSRR